MRFNQSLQKGILEKRYKRFLCDVILPSGERITAHCPNPGSMLGCSEPGSEVLLSASSNPRRKLKHTLELIKVASRWVGVNPMRANAIVEEAVAARQIEGLSVFDHIQREVPYGNNSRIDVLLQQGARKHYIEIKSVTLADAGFAMFPDAPTERGRKHLRELSAMVDQGELATLFFLVQREDTHTFRPAVLIDPAYRDDLERAVVAGVNILVYDCKIDENGIRIRKKLNWEMT